MTGRGRGSFPMRSRARGLAWRAPGLAGKETGLYSPSAGGPDQVPWPGREPVWDGLSRGLARGALGGQGQRWMCLSSVFVFNQTCLPSQVPISGCQENTHMHVHTLACTRTHTTFVKLLQPMLSSQCEQDSWNKTPEAGAQGFRPEDLGSEAPSSWLHAVQFYLRWISWFLYAQFFFFLNVQNETKNPYFGGWF